MNQQLNPYQGNNSNQYPQNPRFDPNQNKRPLNTFSNQTNSFPNPNNLFPNYQHQNNPRPPHQHILSVKY